MSDTIHKGLLPAGLADILPPEADFEVEITEKLISHFNQYGYERVKPPLVEFEDILLSDSGKKMAQQTFRVMDPISQRMLGIRADMTLQIARIASTRLRDVPRPLRLSYAGQVLRVKGSDLRPKRQFAQIGAELIGSSSPRADAEVILMTAKSLSNLGISNLTIDLGLPTLIPMICRKFGAEKNDQLKIALNQKDIPSVLSLSREYDKQLTELLDGLLKTVGPAAETIKQINKLSLPEETTNEIQNLYNITSYLKERNPELETTLDPVESRGFEYHTGVTFTFFALDLKGELGRGGRYLVKGANQINHTEQATGVSLFIDTILKGLPRPKRGNRVSVSTLEPEVIIQLRNKGWIVIEYFDENDLNEQAIARKYGCTHYWENNQVKSIT